MPRLFFELHQPLSHPAVGSSRVVINSPSGGGGSAIVGVSRRSNFSSDHHLAIRRVQTCNQWIEARYSLADTLSPRSAIVHVHSSTSSRAIFLPTTAPI